MVMVWQRLNAIFEFRDGLKRNGVRGSAVFEIVKSAERRLREMKPVTDRWVCWKIFLKCLGTPGHN